jgi:23S rRNA (uridine2552-2'-O)-methyltransferase
MARRSASSGRWRQRQERDPYVERAAREGWRSRAVFKLAEIDEREHLFRPGVICVDLGAAPGAWSQYAARRLGRTGKIWAVDLLPMDPIEGVEFLQGDFTDPEVRARLRTKLPERVDLVMSDMAPNLSGTREIDLPRHLALAEEALAFAEEALKPGGDLLLKLFQGAGSDEFVARVRPRFTKVRRMKPKASRAESSEIYLLARQRRM